MAAYIKEHGDMAGGRKVVFIKRDDTGIAPEVARRQAQDLILNEKVDLLAGLLYTPNAIAVADVSTQAKKPLLYRERSNVGHPGEEPLRAPLRHHDRADHPHRSPAYARGSPATKNSLT